MIGLSHYGQSNRACNTSDPLGFAQTAMSSCRRLVENETSLLCVVQYPLGQVFVSSPDQPEASQEGIGEAKRTKNIQKKPLPSSRKKEQ